MKKKYLEKDIYIYISPEKRQKTVDMIMYNNGISNNKKIYQAIQKMNYLNLEQEIFVKINDKPRGRNVNNNHNGQIKSKNSMIRSNLCDYSNVYILVCSLHTCIQCLHTCTQCISIINNTQIDDAKDTVIPMYKLTEYGDNYSKT